MISEWLKIMLEEIARKKAEAKEARAEQLRRARGWRAEAIVVEFSASIEGKTIGDAE
ncbi:MAG TPA: hypothetical protein VMV25_09165 [Steroidobacteraceae bacterium]|nr:hypothetical protein [Steroidobacteraceae bacterium]